MSKVSRFNIDRDLESEILKQFWYFLGRVNNSFNSEEFYSDFLTDSEKIMLAKRFATAVLISLNKKPSQIHESIHVTYSTIGSVSSWLKNSKPKTKEFFTIFSKEKNFEKIMDKIDEIFDKLPPKIYTNWKTEYKNRAERSKSRMTRNKLS